MAFFVNQTNRPIYVNRDYVVAVSPAYQEGTPVLGITSILVALPPPNVPGAGHMDINVRGSLDEVVLALFGEQRGTDAEEDKG